MAKNPIIGYSIHREVCLVCTKPANPGVTFNYVERGENPTHMQGGQYVKSWCNKHIPPELKSYLSAEIEDWKRVLQTPPGR